MNALSLLADLEARGAVFSVNGDTLSTRPAGILDSNDRNAIRSQKVALVALLKLRAAVEARRVLPNHIVPDHQLLQLWREAENATGQRLRIDGIAELRESGSASEEQLESQESSITRNHPLILG